MNTQAIGKFRNKLKAGQPVYGLFVTLESPSITEMAVALGLDWVVIDAEHGHLDWKEIVEHLRAAVRSDTVALVRITELNPGLIKRSLDIGADGVVIPQVQTAEELKAAVRAARFPPEGIRGSGAERATGWGHCMVEHAQEANNHVLVVPIIESVKGGENLPEMIEVPGAEVFYFGPADYSADAGFPGEWEGGDVGRRIEEGCRLIRESGKHAGVIASNDENLQQRLEQGFRMVGLGMDMGLLLRSLTSVLRSVGRNDKIRTSFVPHSNQEPP